MDAFQRGQRVRVVAPHPGDAHESLRGRVGIVESVAGWCGRAWINFSRDEPLRSLAPDECEAVAEPPRPAA